ncbi:hypothetical protein BC827DRAFT_457214 [Russula dissimulans]|nr:hypothetical protein BC827DRAFT_457214 [Russula dissimulans]
MSHECMNHHAGPQSFTLRSAKSHCSQLKRDLVKSYWVTVPLRAGRSYQPAHSSPTTHMAICITRGSPSSESSLLYLVLLDTPLDLGAGIGRVDPWYRVFSVSASTRTSALEWSLLCRCVIHGKHCRMSAFGCTVTYGLSLCSQLERVIYVRTMECVEGALPQGHCTGCH